VGLRGERGQFSKRGGHGSLCLGTGFILRHGSIGGSGFQIPVMPNLLQREDVQPGFPAVANYAVLGHMRIASTSLNTGCGGGILKNVVDPRCFALKLDSRRPAPAYTFSSSEGRHLFGIHTM
jgi:hypothetical protein